MPAELLLVREGFPAAVLTLNFDLNLWKFNSEIWHRCWTYRAKFCENRTYFSDHSQRHEQTNEQTKRQTRPLTYITSWQK